MSEVSRTEEITSVPLMGESFMEESEVEVPANDGPESASAIPVTLSLPVHAEPAKASKLVGIQQKKILTTTTAPVTTQVTQQSN